MNDSDIEVLLQHPYGGAVWISLAEWMRSGPGARPLLRPVEVRDRRTRQALPLKVVPLAYRNSILSRALVRLGIIPSPWRQS